jgi:hypothetical protein
MVKRKDEGQQRLKVMTTIDESQEKEHIDPSGQVLLFGTQKVLIPPGFEAFADYMNNRLYRTEQKLEDSTEQNKRLANTLERLAPKFEMGVSGTKPDLFIDSLPLGKKADLATVDSPLPAEACYPFVTSELASLIGMHPTRLGALFRRAGITGNDSFHYSFKTGLSGKSQRYKLLALIELFQRAKAGEVEGMKPEELLKLENYLRIREAEA